VVVAHPAIVRADPLVGAVLDRTYRVEAPLARGGMGALYRGTHARLDRPVAIKVLAAAFAGSDTARRRFRREARALARLRSPHVVDVLDVLEAPDGRPVLVTELLDGEDLGQRIERTGALSIPEALAVAAQLADALAVAHAAGVVHRDIKPSNVFLCQTADDSIVLKLLDFGVARLEDDAAITKTGVALGTPLYMAPEQVRKASAADARSDVYGAGAVLYHALAGKAPYPGGNATEALARVLDGPPPPPSRCRPDLPFAVEELVLRAMAREPGARFVDAMSFGARARELGARFAPNEEERSTRRRDKAIYVGGAALVGAGAAGPLAVGSLPVAAVVGAVAGLGAWASLRRWPAAGEHLATATMAALGAYAAGALLGRTELFGALVPFLLALMAAVVAGAWSVQRTRAQSRTTRDEDPSTLPTENGSRTTLPSDSVKRPAIQQASMKRSRKTSGIPAGAWSGTKAPPSSASASESPSSRRRPSARRMATGSASAGY